MRNKFFDIKSISSLHQIIGVKPPKNPLITFVKYQGMNIPKDLDYLGARTPFYIISLKTVKGKIKYGRGNYDFEEGTMMFTAPNQILPVENLQTEIPDLVGWSLFIHQDLLFGTNLGDKMDGYSFFSYESNEALHLSDVEKEKILNLAESIELEYSQNMDQHSNDLIVSNLELLLNYCKRFYDRQFYTRTKQNKGIVARIEFLLKSYFNSDKPMEIGLPTVKYCAEQVHLSPNYLSDLLKKETGKNTKEHIDYFLLKKAKQLLLNTTLNINEIAFDLGYENPKSFSKLFKKKEGVSPKEYRINV